MRHANRMASFALGIVTALLAPMTPAWAGSMNSYSQVVDLGWQPNLTVPQFPSIDNNGNLALTHNMDTTAYSAGKFFDPNNPDHGTGYPLYNYLYKTGSSVNLLPLSLQKVTFDIQGFNSSGDVVGNSATLGGKSYFFSVATGQLIVPQGLPGGVNGPLLYGINNSNQMIGIQGSTPLFYSSPTSVPVALTDLLPLPAGWKLLTVSQINDRGEIVGVGVNPSNQDVDFKLEPVGVPEPTTLAIFSIACVLGVIRRLRTQSI
jgi:hypothetical protein